MAHKKRKHHRSSGVIHPDGSMTHTRHFKHDDGTRSSESSAHHDLDSLHDHLQDHMGAPNPGEAAADAGQHGVPAAMAGPAGLPAAPPMPAPVAGGQVAGA